MHTSEACGNISGAAAIVPGMLLVQPKHHCHGNICIAAKALYPGVAQLVARVVWDFIRRNPSYFSTTAETLDTLRKARFFFSRKIPSKVVHTTCLLLQNKISYSISGCGAAGSAGGLGIHAEPLKKLNNRV